MYTSPPDTEFSPDMLLDEYAAVVRWYDGLVGALFVPQQPESNLREPPSRFAVWYERNSIELGSTKSQSADVLAVFTQLRGVSQQLIDKRKRNMLLDGGDFRAISDLFDKYSDILCSFIKLRGSGRDTRFGLRNRAQMYDDLRREIERMNRRGSHFSVASFSLDKRDDLLDQLDGETASLEKVEASIVDQIAKSVRVFDDVYDFGDEDMFVIVLKQIEFRDAETVLERLRQKIEDIDYKDVVPGKRVAPTITIGLTDALPQETADHLVAHVIKALNDGRSAGGNRVHQYEEVSKLMQFARKRD